MASSGKRKTTMSKLNRERRLHERRLDKKAKKDARKLASTQEPGQFGDGLTGEVDDSGGPDAEQPDLEPVVQTPRDG